MRQNSESKLWNTTVPYLDLQRLRHRLIILSIRGLDRLRHSITHMGNLVIEPRGWYIITARGVCRSVHSKFSKTKQFSGKNNVRYWRGCGTGRVAHWWYTSFIENTMSRVHKHLSSLSCEFYNKNQISLP